MCWHCSKYFTDNSFNLYMTLWSKNNYHINESIISPIIGLTFDITWKVEKLLTLGLYAHHSEINSALIVFSSVIIQNRVKFCQELKSSEDCLHAWNLICIVNVKSFFFFVFYIGTERSLVGRIFNFHNNQSLGALSSNDMNDIPSLSTHHDFVCS